MKLSELSECIVSVPFKRGNSNLELQVNIDAFTPEFFRLQKQRQDEKLKEARRAIARLKRDHASAKKTQPKRLTKAQKAEQEFEQQAQSILNQLEYQAQEKEAERETFAELLSSNVLKGWDLTDDDELPIEPTKEILMQLPPSGLKELWMTCMEAANTVKKRVDEETEEILESTPSGSKGLHVVGQAG